VTRRAAKGAALILLVAVLVLGLSWLLLARLNSSQADLLAAKRDRNARVLGQAKQALIGYVASQTARTDENNPGSLPCPENPGDFDSTTGRQGLVGINCGTTVKVGRFPWRTLGLDQLVDADAEPLWYVVSPAWGVNVGSNSVVNSNSVGQLTVDGVPNAAVALIIAPGAPLSVAAASGCAAWTQVRPPTGTPNVRNYLECENASSPADLAFVTRGPAGSFNDQVLQVTVADLLPAVEAAVAYRMAVEIAPLLRELYTGPAWGLAVNERVFPYAAPFANPEDPANSFSGVAGTLQGLLPFTRQNCSAGSDARCIPSFVSWRNWASAQPTLSATGVSGFTASCSYTSANGTATCSGTYTGGAPTFTMTGIQANVGMALRQATPGLTASVSYNAGAGNVSGSPALALSLKSDGTLAVSTTVSLPGPPGTTTASYSITLPGNVTSDHALLDASIASSTGWFARNGWYKLVYYAVAPGYVANAPAPRSCSDTGAITCLQVVNLSEPTRQRAVLALTGRRLSGQAARGASASVALSDYLESAENTNGDTIFEQPRVGRTANDRFISISKN
jgi:hypothetical protein